MPYISKEKGKSVTLSEDEIKKTFDLLNIDITKNIHVSHKDFEWFLDRKPLKIKIQTNTILNV